MASCNDTTVYDRMQDLDSNAWSEKQELTFDVLVKDATIPYNLYYSVRYDNTYPFYNLYITRILEDSSGKFMEKKLQNMNLFTSDTGIPLGSGMGSKRDYLILSEENYKFPYAGKYTFTLKQYMRQENIQGISAVGFRIDKKTNE
jgi:gliding motility-associated lipoprotein GldH